MNELEKVTDLAFKEVYPSLDAAELREAQGNLRRYLEIARAIVKSRAPVDRAIDIDQPISMIKERSNHNKN